MSKKIILILFTTCFIIILSGRVYAQPNNIELKSIFPFIQNNYYNNKEQINDFINNNTSRIQQVDYNRLVFSALEQKIMYEWMTENYDKNKIIIINIPAYKLYYVIKNPKTQKYYIEWETNIVVGTDYHQTPLNPMAIYSLKYNPTWTPTFNMLRNNLYIDGKLNQQWIDRLKLEPYDLQGNKISWTKVKELPIGKFRLTQAKGANNALGKIKFETQTSNFIYLHDTNHRELFNKQERAFSSGCIRVQNPIKLASLISHSTESYIEKNIKTGKTYWEKVEKTPIYVLYDPVSYPKNKNQKITLHSDPYHKLDNYTVPDSLKKEKNIIDIMPE